MQAFSAFSHQIFSYNTLKSLRMLFSTQQMLCCVHWPRNGWSGCIIKNSASDCENFIVVEHLLPVITKSMYGNPQRNTTSKDGGFLSLINGTTSPFLSFTAESNKGFKNKYFLDSKGCISFKKTPEDTVLNWPNIESNHLSDTQQFWWEANDILFTLYASALHYNWNLYHYTKCGRDDTKESSLCYDPNPNSWIIDDLFIILFY